MALSPEAIRQRAKEGLLALCVGVGLNPLDLLFEEELEENIGEKGKHNSGRKASRHGHESRPVVLGGREARVSRLGARTVDGKGVVLESYEAFKNDEILPRYAFETMLHGLSTRNYAFGLEDVGDVEASGTSESSISRRFARMTREALAELVAKPLDGMDLVVLHIDGIVVAEHMAVCSGSLGQGGTGLFERLEERWVDDAEGCSIAVHELGYVVPAADIDADILISMPI